jgi:hypothetical protein
MQQQAGGCLLAIGIGLRMPLYLSIYRGIAMRHAITIMAAMRAGLAENCHPCDLTAAAPAVDVIGKKWRQPRNAPQAATHTGGAWCGVGRCALSEGQHWHSLPC